MLQYFGVDPWLPAHLYHEGEADWAIVRPPGTMGHAGYLATYLLSVAFLSLGSAKTDSATSWRTVGAFAAGISAIAVVLTGTRGAVVGLAAGAAILWFWFRPRFGRRGIAAGALLAVGIAGFYFSPAGQRLRNRVQWSLEDVHGGARLWLWRDSIRMGADFWAVGTGPETFSAEFPRYQSIELAQAYPNRYNESPHNMFLDAFTAQGVAGLLILCWLVIVPLRVTMREQGKHAALAGFVAAAFVAAVVSNQFLVFTAPTALYFYFGAGLLVALGLQAEKGGPGKTLKNAQWRWAFPIAAVPLGVALIVFAALLAVADRGMWRARERAAAGDVEGAVAAYGQVLRWKPRGMDTDLWFSRLMAGAAQGIQDPATNLAAWLVALSAAERATTATEAPLNAHYNLAALHAMRNDFAGTERALRNAAAAAPQWYKPHWMLAEVLREAGRLDEARAAAEKAMELNGGKDAEVATTWEALKPAGRDKGPL
jgi:tetratricopeptide (TPR) repeat protein